MAVHAAVATGDHIITEVDMMATVTSITGSTFMPGACKFECIVKAKTPTWVFWCPSRAAIEALIDRGGAVIGLALEGLL